MLISPAVVLCLLPTKLLLNIVNKEFYRSGRALLVNVTPIKHISNLMFVWPLLYSPLKVLYLSVLGNKSPKFIDSVRLMEGCAAQYGHTQGQRRSEAVNHPAAYVCESVCVCVCVCVCALHAELVNNQPTQDQTGPQSNQCGFNVHCPHVCVCLCERAGELHHWINPQGEEVDRIMTRPLFSSALLSLSL